MKLYLVRHGKSVFNNTRIHQPKNAELSELGLKQAHFVAKRFLTIPVDGILASDYTRAKQTAEIIQKTIQKPLEFNGLLREKRRPVELEGKNYDDPEAVRIKKLLRENETDPNWHYSDEENFYDLHKRTQQLISVLNQRQEQNLIVVAHEWILHMTTLTMMLGSEMNFDLFHHIREFFRMQNTGITVVERNERGKWHLVTWNDHAHLGEVE